MDELANHLQQQFFSATSGVSCVSNLTSCLNQRFGCAYCQMLNKISAVWKQLSQLLRTSSIINGYIGAHRIFLYDNCRSKCSLLQKGACMNGYSAAADKSKDMFSAAAKTLFIFINRFTASRNQFVKRFCPNHP